jgi:hypothetical protein
MVEAMSHALHSSRFKTEVRSISILEALGVFRETAYDFTAIIHDNRYEIGFPLVPYKS